MRIIVLLLILTQTAFGVVFEYEKLNLKNDWKNIKEKKLEIKKEDIYKFGIVAGGTFLLDSLLKKGVKEVNNSLLDSYTEVVNPLGGPFAGVILLSTYGTGLILNDEKLSGTSFTAIESVIVAGTATGILKHVFGRGRPEINKEENDDPYKFKPFGTLSNSDHDSLPSGHSAIAWAMVTPFAEQYSRYLYILPASVSFARIYKNRHWTSDVLVGAGIGFLTGYTFTKWHNENIEFYGNSIKIKF